MTTSSVSLQDLRRRIYVTAKAEFRLEEVEYRRGSMNGSGSSETTGRLLGCARKRSWSIGHITHDAKQTGERRTGNPFAPFEAAGAGDGPMRAPRQSSTLRITRARPTRPAPPDVESGHRRVVRVRPLPGGVRHREHASARPGLCAVGKVQLAVRSARTGRSRRPDHVQILQRRGPARDPAMPRRSRPQGPTASRARGRRPSRRAVIA